MVGLIRGLMGLLVGSDLSEVFGVGWERWRWCLGFHPGKASDGLGRHEGIPLFLTDTR